MKKSTDGKILYSSASTMTWNVYQKMNREINGKRIRIAAMTMLVLFVITGDAALITLHKNAGYFLLSAGILMPFLMHFIWHHMIRKSYEKNQADKNQTIHIFFCSDHFTIRDENSSSSISYAELYDVIEGTDSFYLLLSPKAVIPVDKKNGLNRFLRQFAAEPVNKIPYITSDCLIIAAAVCLSFYALINAARPDNEILQYWVRNTYCIALALGGVSFFLYCIIFCTSSFIKKRTGFKRMVLRIVAVLICIIAEFILGFLFLYDVLDRDQITQNQNGSFTIQYAQWRNKEPEIYYKDGPFYLSYEDKADQKETENTDKENGFHRIHDDFFADDSFQEEYDAKGNLYVIFEEDDHSVEYLKYDRDSANGKCGLYVFYKAEKDSDGSFSEDTAVIQDIYAYEYSTQKALSSGKRDWSDTGSADYRRLTGE